MASEVASGAGGGRPQFGNFIEIVQDSGSGASAIMGQGDGRGRPETGGVIELDGFRSAKGGNPGPPPKDDPGSDSGFTPIPTYTSGSPNVDDSQEFNITLNFSGSGWTQEAQNIFIAVADYFSSVISGDLLDVIYQGTYYDDITIDVSVVPIDGVGNVLGQAGATLIRGSGEDAYLPLAAIIELDVADVENYLSLGLLDDIVFHEMMHCLGFTRDIWEYQGCLPPTSTTITQGGRSMIRSIGSPVHRRLANTTKTTIQRTMLSPILASLSRRPVVPGPQAVTGTMTRSAMRS